MSASLSTIVAVLGTLLGAVVTHLFQRNSAEQARIFTASQQLRSERLSVYSDFAGAVTEFRRGQYDRWHRKNEDPQSPAYVDARTESYRLRGVSQHALFRVQLIASSAQVTDAARAAYERASAVHRAADSQHLNANGEEARALLEQFIVLASADVR
ncbi:hypothetical protein QFZ82_003992 [Streptomyces sp. V4I23]|uniref:hypothetical protein n=1 Tax=Streptomyces sp. V4I23 TaxID=3042282 RepID=UPI00278663EC|nr:hypothetical protein [Streptomyces sp. V4I23]MDQ1009507.1 hypothetical protein [Streptomyces sp. V4I23]